MQNQAYKLEGLGRNIAAVGGTKPSITEAVCGWRSEVKYYSYFNNSCSRVCGHYTQAMSSQALNAFLQARVR
eukprot:TsM_000357200 transcript=TsM_000357200 gene=TsM_000357200